MEPPETASAGVVGLTDGFDDVVAGEIGDVEVNVVGGIDFEEGILDFGLEDFDAFNVGVVANKLFFVDDPRMTSEQFISR